MPTKLDLDALWKRATVAEDFYRGARAGTRDRDSYEMAQIIKALISELRAAKSPQRLSEIGKEDQWTG
jgi:hypothetical protein